MLNNAPRTTFRPATIFMPKSNDSIPHTAIYLQKTYTHRVLYPLSQPNGRCRPQAPNNDPHPRKTPTSRFRNHKPRIQYLTRWPQNPLPPIETVSEDKASQHRNFSPNHHFPRKTPGFISKTNLPKISKSTPPFTRTSRMVAISIPPSPFCSTSHLPSAYNVTYYKSIKTFGKHSYMPPCLPRTVRNFRHILYVGGR